MTVVLKWMHPRYVCGKNTRKSGIFVKVSGMLASAADVAELVYAHA